MKGSVTGVLETRDNVSARALLNRAELRIPVQDAEFLLAELTGQARHVLYMEMPVRPALQRRFRVLVEQAAAGTPVEYLLNIAHFLDFRLYVDERVLIPRSETEELVTRSKARIAAGPRGLALKILEIGTGSGAVAIGLARAFPDASVLATDISQAALAVARRNLHELGMSRQVRLVLSDVFAGVRAGTQFDLIVSNPPYVPCGLIPGLDRSVREHEPRAALDGGLDGMKIVRQIMVQAQDFLNPGAWLVLEIDPGISSEVRSLLPAAEIEKDWFGLERYCFWRKPG